MATTTPNLGLLKPVVGADADAWGGQLNASLDTLDAKVLDKTTGGTVNGPLSVNGPITAPSVNSATTLELRTNNVPRVTLSETAVTFSSPIVSPTTGGGGSISGDRNRVINGSCQIVNVATFVASNNTSGYGGPEMFYAQNSGGGGQFTQSQNSLTFQGISFNTVRQTVNTAIANTTGVNFWHGIIHVFEGFNVFDLRGKPVVVSFVFNTNVTGTYSVSLRDSNGSQSYVTTISATANTPVEVKIAIPTIPTAANIPNSNAGAMSIAVGFLNTGTFQTSTINQWQSGQFISATGATNWGATVGNFIELTRLQLEEGTVATPFVWRSYGQELALTQRYYEHTYSVGTNPGTATSIGGFVFTGSTQQQGSIFAPVRFSVPKRTTPSITFFSEAGNSGVWSSERSGVGLGTTAMTADRTNEKSFTAKTDNIGAAYAVAATFGHWVANARL